MKLPIGLSAHPGISPEWTMLKCRQIITAQVKSTGAFQKTAELVNLNDFVKIGTGVKEENYYE
ncbi:MAG: hypothetical protein LBK83_16230 [Treponema sp.]|jgi:hypothetical protein|nr:hypothetical protein [Treponema sp.]